MFMDEHPAMRPYIAQAERGLAKHRVRWEAQGIFDAPYLDALTRPGEAAKHVFYLNLPAMLAPTFQTVSAADLNLIECVSFDLYQCALDLDACVDNHDPLPMAGCLGHYQLACTALARRFDINHPVWRTLQHLLADSIAVAAEEQRGAFPDTYGYNQFADVARRKCGLARLLPYLFEACSATSDQDAPKHASTIVTALDHLHVALQWMDDIEDFRADIAQQQPSLLRHRFVARAAAHGIDLANCSGDKQYQLMFAMGLAEDAFQEVADETIRAIQLITHLPLSSLSALLQLKVTHATIMFDQIKSLRAAAAEKAA